MKLSQSRREFMVHSTQAGAALALIGGTSCVLAAAVSPNVVGTAVSSDLLHALGTRIGLEVASVISSDGAPLAMSYLDCAGPSADALRDGIEQGVAWEIGSTPSCAEAQGLHSSILGVALITNRTTGRSARVEIDATALSMLAMIESVKTPASAHKHAVLTASADNLYRVKYLA